MKMAVMETTVRGDGDGGGGDLLLLLLLGRLDVIGDEVLVMEMEKQPFGSGGSPPGGGGVDRFLLGLLLI